MNENELAERFNRELDEVLSGRARRSPFSPDPGAMEIADKLARADFSGDSGIRESLRARLVGADRGAGVFGRIMRLLMRNVYAQSALAAACLLLILLPVMRTGPGKTGHNGAKPSVHTSARPGAAAQLRISSAAVPGGGRAAPVPAGVKTVPRRTAAAAPAPAGGALPGSGVFRSIPMAALAAGRPGGFPIESKKGAYPIGRLKGRKLAFPKGSGVVWETEHAVFTLERREISPDELFQRKAI
ncbi:MAG: hypothetical protein KKH28_14270 [Elusimicrobia bacterium]|nr:hypothetical protein [Elusimicrobiota bacterium]